MGADDATFSAGQLRPAARPSEAIGCRRQGLSRRRQVAHMSDEAMTAALSVKPRHVKVVPAPRHARAEPSAKMA